MALEEHYRRALIATRVSCAESLAPLAHRLIYDLRHYRDYEGGGILTVELVAELDGAPNGREKIMRLWEEMTRKGTRGWRALMHILERMNPDVRIELEETAERLREPLLENGYVSAASAANQYGFYQPIHSEPHEEAGFMPGHHPMPRQLALDNMRNEAMEVESQLMAQAQLAAPQPIGNGYHHVQARLEDPEQESSGALEEEPFYRNSPLSAIGQDARSLLANALNPNKDLLIQIGQELQAPPEVLSQCRRAHNSSGLLFSQLNNATVQDLCRVLKRLRMRDLSDKLVQCIH